MSALVRYDEMCRAIDAAYRVDEVKEIRDKALAFEHYSRQAKNPEPERQACDIRLRAERKVGQLLASEEKAKGARGNPGGQGAAIVRSTDEAAQSPKTLAEMGITKDQSSKWQQLAKVPEEQFEAALAGPSKPSTNGILAAVAATSEASPPAVAPMDPQALWLWGVVRQFERDGLLDRDVNDLVELWTDAMWDSAITLLPRLNAWLAQLSDGEPEENIDA